MRQAVESAEQIKEQLVFEQEDFLIDEVRHFFLMLLNDNGYFIVPDSHQ